MENEPAEEAEVALPAPEVAEVTLGGGDEATRAEGTPVELKPGTAALDGEEVQVAVLDESQLSDAVPVLEGAPLAIRLSGAKGEAFDEALAGDVADPAPLSVSIDYSGWKDAYGAGFVDRARIVALPSCAVEVDRAEATCDKAMPVPLDVRNDADASRLVVEIDDLAALGTQADDASAGAPAPRVAGATTTGSGASAETDQPSASSESAPIAEGAAEQSAALAPSGGGVVLALTAGTSGELGDYGITPFSASSSWQVGLGTGEFSWSYDIGAPAPPSGAAPQVSVGYSSGAVDGMVASRNTQGSQVGVGWGDFAGSFIERRYDSCTEAFNIDDLCWKNDNATISLNGTSSELVPLDGAHTSWRLKDDPGWVVERPATGRPSGNGDNDNEFWKVITPDGTQYWFGWGKDPDGAATQSVWSVPVWTDAAATTDCAGTGFRYCNQAWRWNLDRVIDPNGNTTVYSYERETNKYLAARGYGGTELSYTRAGALSKIEYGSPTGTPFQPAAQVLFTTPSRCAFLVDWCPTATSANGDSFRDVPNDLICTSGCVAWSPSFFSSKRYSKVRKEVLVGGSWRPVDEVALGASFLANTDGVEKMYLTGLQRKGLSEGDETLLPEVNIWHAEYANRVDVNVSAGKLPMGHWRPIMITDEYGRETWVTYSRPHPCASTYTGPWNGNAKNCFPQKVNGSWAVFNKYVTTQVKEVDGTGGSPDMVTTYDYVGTPAWHWADDEFVTASEQTWSDWRGYGSVVVTQGESKTRYQVFRGMHNDRASTSGGLTSVQVEPFDGAGFDTVPAVNDDNALAGLPLAEAKVGILNQTVQATHHAYEQRWTTLQGSDPQDYATWVGETATTDNIWTGAASTFKAQRKTTTYDTFFQPETILEEGWVDTAGDERCTKMTYATNTSAGNYKVAYPATSVLVSGNCASTTELSRSETYYDGLATVGAAPDKGNVTKERAKTDANTWVTTSEATYDYIGRTLTSTDGNGNVTATGYEWTPNGGYPRETSVTSQVNGVDHVTLTEWLPEYGVPIKVTDPNGNVTTYGYDALGRPDAVRLPTEQPYAAGRPRSNEFAYYVSANKSAPPTIRARQLIAADESQSLDSWVIYDSFLRERQTQVHSPSTGYSVVTDTTYDNRGLVKDQLEPQAVEAAPGTGLLQVNTATSEGTRNQYDTIGRPIKASRLRNGAEAWWTVTDYTHDTTTVTPPRGGQARTVVDGLGRTTKREEHDGTAWRTTTLGYDLGDRLTSITDAAGNKTTYGYDMAGRRTSQSDADAGDWTYAYDAAGNQTRSTDAKNVSVYTNYDALNRPIDRRRDTASGTVLASWAYDTKGKGLLASATTASAQGNWVIEPTGYDGRNRPTGQKWAIPAGVLGTGAVNYTVDYDYDKADNVTTTGYDAIGGLPAEDVTTAYSSTGYPATMTGAANYVGLASYDPIGRPAIFGFGATGGTYSAARAWAYDADQRVASITNAATGGTQTSRQDLAYDQLGNVTERTTALGSQSFRECFTYDARNQLTKAVTRTATTTCAAGTGAASGDLAYERNYTYGVDGNMLTRNSGGANTTYTYPTAGPTTDRPHAPTTVGTSTYQWDANGNLASRTIAGQTETFTFNAEQRLETVAGPAGTSKYTYTADGERLYQETPGGTKTVYLDGQEVTKTSTTTTATRTYSFNGELIATRTPTALHYVGADQQNSIQASVTPGASTPDNTQAYDPYGQKRGTGTFDTQRGWLSEIEDTTTKLSYLNARYYDPNLGRFISPDPVIDTNNPTALNPYTYGNNNPTTDSDPSGMWIPITNYSHGNGGYNAKWKPATNQRNIDNAVRVVASLRTRRTASGDTRRRQRPHPAYVAPSRVAAALREISQLQNDNPKAYAALAGIATLMQMRSANPDPAFWFALKSAGSGKALQALGQLQELAKTSYCEDVSCVTDVLRGELGPPSGFQSWGNSRARRDGGVYYEIDYFENDQGDFRAGYGGGSCSARVVGNTGMSFDFTSACQTHDLGYDLLRYFDNPGGGETRRSVDKLLLNDMNAHCGSRSIGLRMQCLAWSGIYYGGVRGNSQVQDDGVP